MPSHTCMSCFANPCCCYAVEARDANHAGYAADDTGHQGPPLPRYSTACPMCHSKPCLCTDFATSNNGICRTCYANPCCCYVKREDQKCKGRKGGGSRSKASHSCHSARTHERPGRGSNPLCKTCNLPYAECCCGTRPRGPRRFGLFGRRD